MDKFRQERRAFVNALAEVGIASDPLQANYLLCELTNGESATKLAEDLLDEDNILIKDLSTKKDLKAEIISGSRSEMKRTMKTGSGS